MRKTIRTNMMTKSDHQYCGKRGGFVKQNEVIETKWNEQMKQKKKEKYALLQCAMCNGVAYV